jgi:hypothetical protein
MTLRMLGLKHFAPVLAILVASLWPWQAQATMIALSSISQISGPTILFNTPGSVTAQTTPFGVDTFASNSFSVTEGISGAFTGNANAPLDPPSAMEFGPTPGIATYFHFSPHAGFNINAIGVSATGAFTDQTTTFQVIAIDTALHLLQYNVTMTPTASGIAGLNGGAVFLGVSSTIPLTTFRVVQLDRGFGILDDLRVNVTAVPEPSALLLACSVLPPGAFGLVWSRVRKRPCPRTDKRCCVSI